NTWQRCAAFAGINAALALLVQGVTSYLIPETRPYTLSGVLDLGVLFCAASALAVFGSYRMHGLQQQAYEARKLGQYRLQEQIGSGGMGEVYLAEHVLLRRPCAIKLIHPYQLEDPSALSRFEREVQAMATLTHWNNIEIFDYGRADDGTFYYVMEYLP